MKPYPFILLLLAIFFIHTSCAQKKATLPRSNSPIECWVTTNDRHTLLKKISPADVGPVDATDAVVIDIDSTRQYQRMDGFGFALTGGSAFLLNHTLRAKQRDSLLNELFRWDDNNIGVSYLRISIGASDLDDHVFTYDDLPAGDKDPDLKKFSIESDKVDLIPVLKQVLARNPTIKIMGSPWSAPAWMKTNNNLKGGSLKPEYYQAFANYFVKYVQAMAAEGITIDAITLQNEPENPKNNPSMLMTAEEQTIFVKNNLGPAFKKANIKTKIIVFDHNCDHPDYPIAVLDDKGASQFIDGSAFHLYLGEISALAQTHTSHPDKNVYFTEQWTSGRGDFAGDLQWHVKNLIIGAPRNWSKNVLEWNLAADAKFAPHTNDGGCNLCMGALTIDQSITKNVSYYIIGHASKFVRPGSVRVESSANDDVPNVAYITPEGKKVLIVLNEKSKTKTIKISFNKKEIITALPGSAVGTFVW